jgi:two-component system chemotaxis sensor kinase CheA
MTGAADEHLSRALGQLRGITKDLQRTTMSLRMVPIRGVFQKMSRLVRDVAAQLGKEIRLVLDGDETELDRTVIEEIADPLVHMIRNSADHGIESPADRVAAGKPRAGTITLQAFHQGGFVVIRIADDGRGLDPARIRATAEARGIVSRSTPLEPREVLELIFAPGFSTAAAVTDLSGRGVGMDVVRTNIEAIGGTVDIHSQPGAGTTVRVHVPLTLAIMPALVVRCGSERFAIPQSAVGELVPVTKDRHSPRIEGLADAPVMRVRGRLVPILFLDQFLGVRETTACRDEGTVVLVRVDDREFGLVVDGMQSRADQFRCRDLLDSASLSTIVVKPIGGLLAALGMYSGATVLGDGGVVLILDLRGLHRIARLPPVAREPEEAVVPAADIAERYLVCGTPGGRRVAGGTRMAHGSGQSQ